MADGGRTGILAIPRRLLAILVLAKSPPISLSFPFRPFIHPGRPPRAAFRPAPSGRSINPIRGM